MPPHILTEDDIYRASTQYRLWSFTPEALASVRSSNNAAASEQARIHFQSANKDHNDSTSQSSAPHLSTQEELHLLSHSTRHLVRIASQVMGLPTPITATGAVYLRRFYLSHSPLTNLPHAIMPACLFLATKTEHYYVPLSKFVDDWTPQVTAEDIIREEGTVTQALRFCLEVRHPFRGLRGALLELRALAEGKGAPMPASRKSAAEAQAEMQALPLPAPASTSASTAEDTSSVSVKEAQDRAFQAHDRAKQILTSAGLLTDAYFLYTPAQVMFAALMLADEPLTRFYLSTKLARPSAPPRRSSSGSSPADAAQDDEQRSVEDEARARNEVFNDKLLSTIRGCAELLSAALVTDAEQEEQLERVAEIERKLSRCRHRLGWDDDAAAAGYHVGDKRNGEVDDKPAGDKSVKKRKLANGQAVDSPFGGPLETGEGTAKARNGNDT